MPTSIRVQVMGRDYALRVHEDSQDELRKVASEVDEKMQAFQKAHPGQARLTAAVITALGLADELHQARKKLNGDRTETRQAICSLNNELEEVLSETPQATTS